MRVERWTIGAGLLEPPGADLASRLGTRESLECS